MPLLFLQKHPLWKTALMAIGASAILNVVALTLLRPFVTNEAHPLMALTLGPVIMFTVVGALGASIVFAIVRWYSSKPERHFLIIGIIVLLLSFIPDFMIIGATTGRFAGTTVSEAFALMALHVVAAVVILVLLIQLTQPIEEEISEAAQNESFD